MQNEDWKKELVETFFAHKGVVLASTILLLLGAAGIAFYWPPTFAASGSVLVRGISVQVSPQALGSAELKNLNVAKEDIATEVQILSSPDLLRKVVLGDDGPMTEEGQKQVARIRSSLQTEVVPTSNVIAVRLYDRDPAWAEKTLDEILRRYIVFRAEVFHPVGQESFLSTRADKYKAELTKVEDDLLRLSGESSVTLPEREITNNVDLVRDLKKQLGELRLEHIQLDREIRPLKQALAEDRRQYFAFLNLEAIDSIGSRLKDLQVEFSRLDRSFQPDSGKLQAVKSNVQGLADDLRYEVQRVLETRTVTLEGNLARQQELMEAIRAIEKRNVELDRHATEVTRLRREAALLTFSYDTFSKRAEEARINSAIAAANFSGEVSILSGAKNSAALIFPLKGMTIGIGLFVGLVTGCSLALLLEFFDHTLKRPGDVARFSQLPMICSIRKV